MANGDREAATVAAHDAHEIALRLGSAWLVAEVESLIARARLPSDTAGAAAGAPDAAAEPDSNPFELTDRELQVLVLLATGATNREIGEQLFRAEKTASVHVSRILAKLGVGTRGEAGAVAHKLGLDA